MENAKFAIGINEDILLIRRKLDADVGRMVLVHRDDFKPSSGWEIVICDNQWYAMMIATLFDLDRAAGFGGGIAKASSSRLRVGDLVNLRVLAVPAN